MLVTLRPDIQLPYKLIFTNRGGGVSEPPYDTLNLGFHTGDSPSRVLENRVILCRSLGIELERLTLLRQVHSDKVVKVGPGEEGAGSMSYEEGLDDADAMITENNNAVLCVLVADCFPVAIYSDEKVAFALVHAGWRGTYMDIIGRTVIMMSREFRVSPGTLYAVIGPGIHGCCYKVNRERGEQFLKKYNGVEASLRTIKGFSQVVAEKNGIYHIDLAAAIRINLIRAGVQDENIVDLGVCTHCDKDFFSFRRDGDTGRQAALFYVER